MANEQNLIPWNKRTESEQREYARQGGKKSGEVRRKKKAMKDMMQLILSLELPECKGKKELRNAGIDEEDMNIQTAILMAQIQKAMKGNLESAKFVRDVSENIDEQAVNEDDRVQIINDLPEDESYDKTSEN